MAKARIGCIIYFVLRKETVRLYIQTLKNKHKGTLEGSQETKNSG